MKKRIIAAFAAAAVLLAAGCSGNTPAQTTAAAQESKSEQTTAAANDTDAPDNDEDEDEDIDDEDEEEDDETDDGENAAEKEVNGFALSVNGSDGKMRVSRAKNKSQAMGEPDVWTIFVYLCGTDLESEDGYGAASGDIAQMLEAEGSDNVRFVIQTGGTSQWQNEVFSSDECGRYLLQNQDITSVDSVPLANMGSPDTLADFLEWGVENYASEKMGVVFWDHGGGSITGVCVDELFEGDTLYLSEINSAFSKVYANMTDKFEFVGFDCCLMGTAETANILASYARYFYGSQETEPGSGWDYTAIGNFLAQNPSANGAELGKVVADSFYAECEASEQEDGCTFTIVDCDKIDEFIVAFNDYMNELYGSADSDLAGIVRGVNNAENFGGNNKSESYTNMVDIGGIVKSCSSYADGSALLSALDDCIVYNINGINHSNASGLSVYYPLCVQGSEELKVFSGICISPFYLSLVDMVAKGYTGNGYDNQVFFTEDGDWEIEDGSCEYYDDSYFDYADEESDEQSELITFAAKPYLDDDGVYAFMLDENGLEYTAGVSAYIIMKIGDNTMLELGETYDVYADWEKGIFTDNFDGSWLSLPDGSLLALYIVGFEDGRAIYTSPIELNGKRTNLRIVQTSDSIYIDGAWDGIDENGMASREVKKLKAGDMIAPIYYFYEDDDDEQTFTADAYEWSDGDTIQYSTLPDSNYYYAFCIDDVYGDFYMTDPVCFTVEGDKIRFSDLSE